MSWLDTLNLIQSPQSSPENGPADPTLRSENSLSYPVSQEALAKQLEVWTNVNFDTSAFSNAPIASTRNLPEDSETFFGHFFSQNNKQKAFNNAFDPSTSSKDDLPYFSPQVVGPSIDPMLYAIPPFYTGGTSPLAVDGSNLLIYPGQSDVTTKEAPQHTTGVGTVDTPEATVVSSEVSSPNLASSAGSHAPVATKKATTKKDSAAKKTNSTGNKRGRKPLVQPDFDQNDPEAVARAVAIEEDKRRRNTAASARFRVKKKQREQALESTTKDLSDKVKDLEKQLDALRMENQWLRSLITEKAKGGDITLSALAPPSDLLSRD